MAPGRVEGSFLTIIIATIFAPSLVPAGAWAAETHPQGAEAKDDLEESTGEAKNTGTLTLGSTKRGETYDVYRLFELASFTDENNATGNHVKATEAYRYVINSNVVRIKNKQTDGSVEVTSTPNAWLGFLLKNGPGGKTFTLSAPTSPVNPNGYEHYGIETTGANAWSDTNHPYAMWSDGYESAGLPPTAKAAVYFVIEREAVTLNLPNPKYVCAESMPSSLIRNRALRTTTGAKA